MPKLANAPTKYLQEWNDRMQENIAAISAELFIRRPRTRNGIEECFYDRHKDAVSGFPGVWRFAINAARIFTTAEPKTPYEWLDAILPFAEWLADIAELPTETEMRTKAEELIAAAV